MATTGAPRPPLVEASNLLLVVGIAACVCGAIMFAAALAPIAAVGSRLPSTVDAAGAGAASKGEYSTVASADAVNHSIRHDATAQPEPALPPVAGAGFSSDQNMGHGAIVIDPWRPSFRDTRAALFCAGICWSRRWWSGGPPLPASDPKVSRLNDEELPGAVNPHAPLPASQ